MPDKTTVLCFRHLLNKHQLSPHVPSTINATVAQQGLMLKTGTIVDATIIAAPSSTNFLQGKGFLRILSKPIQLGAADAPK